MKGKFGFGIAALIAVYLMIERSAGSDGQAAAFLTGAAAFLLAQYVFILTDR